MKKLFMIFIVVAFLAISSSAFADEYFFSPGNESYGFEGIGELRLWGIPAMSGDPAKASVSMGQNELSIAVWWNALQKAQELGLKVQVYFDPSNGYIWYMSGPLKNYSQ